MQLKQKHKFDHKPIEAIVVSGRILLTAFMSQWPESAIEFDVLLSRTIERGG